MTGSLARRLRVALLGAGPAGARHVRHTADRPLWRRYLASLLGVPLPPAGSVAGARPAAAAGSATDPGPAPEPGVRRRQLEAAAHRLRTGWRGSDPLARLAGAAGGWAAAPAAVRLHHREALLRLADCLSPAADGAGAEWWAAAADGLSARALTRAADLARVGRLAKAVEDALSSARRGAERAAHRGLDAVAEPARALTDRPVTPDGRIVAAAARAGALLRAAATEFGGADLTEAFTADPLLAGVRWDAATRWPDDGWARRMRDASAEDPPGSGRYVVLPEWRRDAAPSPTG